LLLLHGIGPRRAERIVRYRKEVSNIGSIYDLATATGMSLQQAGTLSQLVEWENPKTRFTSLLMPAFTYAGCSLLVFYGFSEIQIDLTSPARLLYNLSLMMIMLGCISLIFEQLVLHLSKTSLVVRPLAIISITAFLIGIVSLISLLGITVILDRSPDLTTKMTATTNFLIFVFLITYLINAPSIHLKRNNLYSKASSKNINNAAILFDYGLLLLAFLVYVMLTRFNSGMGIEEIFAIWASVLLASSGADMTRGRSAYVVLLSGHEKEKLQFIRSTDEETDSTLDRSSISGAVIKRLYLMKLTGILLICLAAFLFGLAVYQLV